MTVTASSDAPGTASVTGSVSFSTSDYNVTRQMTVTGHAEGGTFIRHSLASSADPFYASQPVRALKVTVSAADSVRILPTSLKLTEGGGTGTYKVSLTSNPNATVTVTPTSDDTGAATVSDALTFNASTWSIPQTVTVTPVDDNDMDDESVDISHTVTGYPGVMSAPDVTVAIRDNDVIPTISITGFAVSQEGTAGGTATFTVQSSRAPTDPLAVHLNLSDEGDFFDSTLLGARSLTIAADATSARLTVPIVDDAVDEGFGFLTATLVADTAYVIADDPGNAHRMAINDDDETEVELSVPTGNINEKGGAKTLTLSIGRGLTADTVLGDTANAERVAVRLRFGGTATLGTDFTLSAPDTAPKGVTYSLGGNTPTVTFKGPSADSATVKLQAMDDTDDEGSGETVSIALASFTLLTSNLAGGVAGSGTGAFNIIDDDGADSKLSVSVTAGDDITEGGTASFTISVAPAPAADLVVSLGVSQTGSFVASSGLGSDDVTIAAGEDSATFTVDTVDDTGSGADEPDGAVTLTVNTATSYSVSTGTASVGVADNDATTVVLSVPDATATEADPANAAGIRVTLGRGLVTGESLSVPLNFTGGTSGTDFALTLGAATGVSFDTSTDTLTFTGQSGAATTANLAFNASADADTADATVTVSLGTLAATGLSGGVSGSRTGNGQIAVTDIGVARSIGWASTALTVTETAAGGSGTGSAALSTGTGPVTFRVCLADGTAIRPGDYTGFTGGNACTGTDTTNADPTITGSQSSRDVAFALTADTVDEPDETFTATLSLPATVPALSVDAGKATLTVTVADDDPTNVTFGAGGGNLPEGETKTLTLALERALVDDESLTVPITFGSGSSHAVRGTDFTLACPDPAPSGVTCANLNSGNAAVTFSAGARRVFLTLTAVVDGIAEATGELVDIGLGTLDANSGTNLGGGARGTDAVAPFQIADGGAQPAISIAPASNNAITEGGGARFILTATPAPDANLAVQVTIAEDASDGRDFVAAGVETTRTVTIAADAATRPFTVATVNDSGANADEPNGTVTATVTGTGGYTITSASQAEITVNDNDPTRVTLAGSSDNLYEGEGKDFTITLGRGLVSGETLAVPLRFSGGALRGTDYTLACEDPLPADVACGNLDSGNAAVTFTGPDSGATDTEVTLTFTASSDGLVETATGEKVNIDLGTLNANSGTGLSGGARGTDNFDAFRILDAVDIPVNLSVSAAEVVEGGSLTLTATLGKDNDTGAALTIPVQVRSNGTTAQSADYSIGSSISIANGSRSGTLTFTTSNNDDDEPRKSVVMELGSPLPEDYGPGSASARTITIVDDEPTTVTLTIPDGTAIENSNDRAQIVLALNRALAPGERLAVPLGIAGGALGDDFSLSLASATGVALNGAVVTFTGRANAAATATLTLTALEDADPLGEMLTVSIPASSAPGTPRLGATNLDGGAQGSGGGSIGIRDATQPGVTVAPGEVFAPLDGEVRYTMRLNTPPDGNVVVTATSADTTRATVGGPFTFTASNWNEPRPVTIQGLASGTTRIDHAITTGDGADYLTTLAVPPVKVQVLSTIGPTRIVLGPATPARIQEGEVAEFLITIGGEFELAEPAVPGAPPRPILGFHIQTEGTAHAPTDHVGAGGDYRVSSEYRVFDRTYEVPVGYSIATGRYYFRPNERVTRLWLKANRDKHVEGTETVTLTLVDFYNIGRGVPASLSGSTTVTIEDATPSPAPQAAFSLSSASAGEGSGTHDVTVSLSAAAASALTLNYTLGGTAVRDEDYAITGSTDTGGTVSIAAGAQSATIPIEITDDSTEESAETIVVTLTEGTGYRVGAESTYTLTIADDDTTSGGPLVSFAVASQSANEGEGVQTVTVNVTPAPDAALTLRYTAGGTATRGAGNDYTIASSGTVEVSAGSSSADITVTVNDDTRDEGSETVILTLSAGSGYTVGSPNRHTLTITDNDGAAVAGGLADIYEGETLEFTVEGIDSPFTSVTLTTTAGGTATRDFDGTADAGEDFRLRDEDDAVLDTSHSLAPSGGEVPFKVQAIADSDDTEGEETIVLTLIDSGGNLNTVLGTLTLKNGPRPTAGVTVSTDPLSLVEGEAAGSYTVALTKAPAAGQTVRVTATSDRPAAVRVHGPGGSPGTRAVLTFTHQNWSQPQTVTVTPLGDDDADDESVTITHTVQGTGEYANLSAASVAVTVTDTTVLPEVSVTGPASVTEGEDVTFTVAANPAPSRTLRIELNVGQTGAFAAAGQTGRTVVVIASGTSTADLTVETHDDDRSEVNGAVTATVQPGRDYAVAASPADAASVTVADDDGGGVPVVSITSSATIAFEGDELTFTLAVDPKPAANLDVTVDVAESGGQGFVATAGTGTRTVTVAANTGSATVTVPTVDDNVEESGTGTITVTVQAGNGYLAAPSPNDAASVEVNDNDGITISIADAQGVEGMALDFAVTLSAPSPGNVSVRWHIDWDIHIRPHAVAGVDFLYVGGDLYFGPGETRKTISIWTENDAHDDPDEKFLVLLSRPRGAVILDGRAVGTITNDGPLPQAWLARFGRTVAEQTLDAVSSRIGAARNPGVEGTLAGQSVVGGASPHGAGDGVGGTTTATRYASSPDRSGAAPVPGLPPSDTGSPIVIVPGQPRPAIGARHDLDDPWGPERETQSMTGTEVLAGTAFTLTARPNAAGGTAAFWGRGAHSTFEGEEDAVSFDGKVTGVLMGVDYAQGPWLVGLGLARSEGEGDYRSTRTRPSESGPSRMNGRIESSLTSLVPYAAVEVSPRLELWGAAGAGAGEVTLTPGIGHAMSADVDWLMSAAGLRGTLLAPAGGGPTLALVSDALWARTTSERTQDLAASQADVTRLRLGLEGSWAVALDRGGVLMPRLETGLRHDGGDAETGFGVEFGGGFGWNNPRWGLDANLEGRTLIAHEEDGFEDRGFAASFGFDPDPGDERGFSLRLRHELGGPAADGLEALFTPDPLALRTAGGTGESRWAAEAAYGLPVFGGRFTGSPHLRHELSGFARDTTLGWRLEQAEPGTTGFSLDLKATRRDFDSAEPDHVFGIEMTARW